MSWPIAFAIRDADPLDFRILHNEREIEVAAYCIEEARVLGGPKAHIYRIPAEQLQAVQEHYRSCALCYGDHHCERGLSASAEILRAAGVLA
jgi:hypothetical protein